jgi:uncharacterized protein (TIGR04255 family)
MAITFKNAPLIEAVAELRWGAVAPIMVVGQPFNFTTEVAAGEEFFMHFGAECSVRGMMRAERVLPQGMPAFPGQVVYRFRSPANGSSLLQVGPGVFSANALPPYGSWEGFKDHIGVGLDVLLSTRPEHERDAPFSHVNIRYINGFGDDYLGGISGRKFLEVLGFGLQQPGRLMEISKEAAEEAVSLSITTKVSDVFTFQVNISEGIKDGLPAKIVELSATTTNVAANSGALLEVLQSSHDLIEQVFLEVTQAFHHFMAPQGN